MFRTILKALTALMLLSLVASASAQQPLPLRRLHRSPPLRANRRSNPRRRRRQCRRRPRHLHPLQPVSPHRRRTSPTFRQPPPTRDP